MASQAPTPSDRSSTRSVRRQGPLPRHLALVGLVGLACYPAGPPPPAATAEAGVSSAAPAEAVVSIPLTFLDHFAVVPVRINDAIDARMILDTGIGVTVLSAALCRRAGCEAVGEYTGERMSGQRVTIPLARLGALDLGSHREERLQIGVIDNPELLPPGIDGILSLGFFEAAPFTLDDAAGLLTLEDATSLARRQAAGASVPVEIRRDGASVTAFMSLDLPQGPPVRVELDTGSDSLILDVAAMSRLGVDPADPAVRRASGTDETGHAYVRHFTTLAGAIAPTAAPHLRQERPRVMFQRIIHDGLLGRSFLRAFAVTFDLPRARIILGPPAPPPTPPR